MELSRAIRIVVATFRRRPAQLLPFYVLTMATPSIMRVLSFFGLFVLIGYLYQGGHIAAFQEELDRIDTDPPAPETEPEAFVEWAEGLEPLIETVVTPTTVIILALTGLVTMVGIFLLSAAMSAGQFATCFGLLQGDNGIVRGIDGVKRHWLRFVGLYLLELVLWAVVTGMLVGLVVLSLVVSLVIGLFVGIFAAFLWIAAAIAIRATFAFAPVAIVVDDAGVVPSLQASLGFIRAQFANAVVYYVIAIGVLLGWGGVSSTLATFGVPSIAVLGSLLLVAPGLDLLKTVLYGDYRNATTPFDPPSAGIGTQVKRGLRRGLAEMTGFVRATPGLHGLSIGAILAGVATGWILIEPIVGDFQASITGRIAGLIPPTAALEFFSNNFTVALTLAYSGVAATIPAVVGLWFNGLVIGTLARLEAEPAVLVAFLVPHGIFEIPAIVIAGAVGLYLGRATWRSWRGRIDRQSLAGSFERAMWILVGVGILLAIAGFVEGFISPYYFRLFL